MQLPHHKSARLFAVNDTAAIKLLEQRHASDNMLLALVVIVLIVVVTVCRLPGKTADDSKQKLIKQFNLRAASQT